ncbi:MAG: DNA/RNA non-specific endonuclease, partial [Firmicutes bacterium]|nr:DNA/RNA non-specific endonuclease [Bacillota bacterium]
MKKAFACILIFVVLVIAFFGYSIHKYGSEVVWGTFRDLLHPQEAAEEVDEPASDPSEILAEIPDWDGLPFVYVNENVPTFSEEERWTAPQVALEPLDELGRCGKALACIGTECMPDGDRGPVARVYPSGWQNNKYDFIEGEYLFNRCHLLAYQLTGDEGIDRNLITGTRYMNVSGMLPLENALASYVRLTGKHVMYRVTPIYSGKEPVAWGVQMEAMSVEDKGKGFSFNVFCYNVQPGVEIDYSTGRNKLSEDERQQELITGYQKGYLSVFPRTRGKVTAEELEALRTNQSKPKKYYINTYSGKFHVKGCEKLNKSKKTHIHKE